MRTPPDFTAGARFFAGIGRETVVLFFGGRDMFSLVSTRGLPRSGITSTSIRHAIGHCTITVAFLAPLDTDAPFPESLSGLSSLMSLSVSVPEIV